jgi:NhaP-type Na+/H+ or K+/H+ antiporter
VIADGRAEVGQDQRHDSRLIQGVLVLSSNEALAGLGLVVVLAMGCRLLARRLRLPVIVVLLPVGFAGGGRATNDVHPNDLLGGVYQPFVSVAVGLILFEAGLRLRLGELAGGDRRVVRALILIGGPVTAVGVTVAVELIFGLGWGISLVLGAILVVPGPTVVLPLLAFVRPSDRLRSVLKFEGVLIDPIGALLGVLASRRCATGSAATSGFTPASSC